MLNSSSCGLLTDACCRFQAIKQNSAVTSGIHNLPIILSVVVSSIAAGGGVAWIGYYVPFLILGTICMSVGGGLLMTLQPDSSIGSWIGYQILFGAGVGMSLEQCNIAIQATLPAAQIASGTALSIFARSLGGAIGIAAAQNAFQQTLVARRVESGGSSGTPELPVGNNGKGLAEEVLRDYNSAVTRTFMVVLVLACLTALPALGMEWRSVKKDKTKVDQEEKGIEKDAMKIEGEEGRKEEDV